ncbi:phosphotransferase family protein [Sphingorhabdus pulchriflava]|uniref:Phosphotransferase family protein n=1 Tax=Sphingorhabdus pulchriflava TaxID=2292257 RepID=A0A371BG95_9SPHN|nr:phosphotransferase family protein [Sphingorhabdus pulchriflava]RDV06616.1 phosphotransferase family protein [Sphingorhabdus pulchriflava]
MNLPAELNTLLPDGLFDAVQSASGAAIEQVRPRGGGGASREGAELDLRWPDGRMQTAYMNYDVHRAGAGDDDAFLREAAIIKSLSGQHKAAGVKVAPFIAAIPEKRALLGGFVDGEANFNKLVTPEDRMAVAVDFMDQLAKLHKIDVSASPVEGMGPVSPISTLIDQRIDLLRRRNKGKDWDPLIQLSIDWLADNVPSDLPAPVIVHGDAGPANFLYSNGKVTILLDWELVHYGDPMADLAMLCLRMLFQPFVPLPSAFAAYEAAGGYPVDLDRVRYWRLLFQTGFARASRFNDPDAPPPPNLGMNMVYSTIHRRVLSEALAEAAGMDLEPVALPDSPLGAHHRSFDIALDDIRDIVVPRLADQQAAAKAKGLARLVKWWRDIERFEPGFHEAERVEIGAALGREFTSHAEAWTAYCAAVKAGTLNRKTAIQIANAHATRDAALMADAMGALAKTRFTPLS